MKKMVSVLLLATLAFSARAQQHSDYIKALETPSGGQGTVTVTESAGVEAAVGQFVAARATGKVRGFRVSIFSDNSQTARYESEALCENFKTNFPDIPVYREYKSPYYKVTVGNCLTRADASVVLSKIQATYPKSIIVPADDIPLSVFMQ